LTLFEPSQNSKKKWAALHHDFMNLITPPTLFFPDRKG
jgi:hypothetical protein